LQCGYNFFVKFINLCAALLLLAASGCNKPQTAPPKGQKQKGAGAALPFQAKDDWNRDVSLNNAPQRVVVIGPGATEMMFALGKGDLIVGRDSASDFPAAANKIPIVADFRGPFFESVRAVRPDFILVQGETYDAARLDAWQKKCGAPVAGLAATNLRGVQADMEKIGAWLRVEPQKIAAQPKIDVAPQTMKGTAFLEVSRRPLMTAGSDTLIGDAVARAGLKNVAQIKGYKNYSLETLATQKPKFYIVTGDPAQRADIVRELQSAPGLKDLSSIRAGRIVVVSGDLLLRPGPRLVQGIEQLASAASKQQ
jgi:iron complex transport system substrate-binding protein